MPPFGEPPALPLPGTGIDCPFGGPLVSDGFVPPLGEPGLPVSLPSGVAFGAVLTELLPSLPGDVRDGLFGAEGGASAVAFSLDGDCGVLVCGDDGEGEDAGLSSGATDTAGTAILGAATTGDGADGGIVGAGVVIGVSGIGASCGSGSLGVAIGPNGCCDSCGAMGAFTGASDGCKFTVGACCAGIGIGSSGGDGGEAGAGAGAAGATLGIGMGAMEGFSTAMCGGAAVSGDCTGCVGTASDGNGGIGCVPSACGLRGGSGWKGGGTG